MVEANTVLAHVTLVLGDTPSIHCPACGQEEGCGVCHRTGRIPNAPYYTALRWLQDNEAEVLVMLGEIALGSEEVMYCARCEGAGTLGEGPAASRLCPSCRGEGYMPVGPYVDLAKRFLKSWSGMRLPLRPALAGPN